MIEWINVKDRLPKDEGCYLGYCQSARPLYGLPWNGIIHVYFNPQKGWCRYEDFEKDFSKILYWSMLPKLPTIEEK